MSGLAHELMARGHRVVFHHLPEFETAIRERGLAFEPYGATSCLSPDYFAGTGRRLSALEGEAAVRLAGEMSLKLAQALLQDPTEIAAESDLWVVDQMDYAAATLAAARGRSFVTAIVTLMKNNEEGVPGFNGRPFSTGESDLSHLVTPLLNYLDNYRRAAGLGGFSYDTLWSERAQITQQPIEFEFPRKTLPECFLFTGPFSRPPDEVPFPWERLDDRPLVYVSFGTAQNRRRELLEAVVRGTRGLGVQTVVSSGGAEALEFPEDVLALPYVPQRKLLERAAVTVTHAGMNSTLEALVAGVPMLAVPLAHDQPGVAARIVWSGTGLKLAPGDCHPQAVSTSLRRLLGEPTFRDRAQTFHRLLAERRGACLAADRIEKELLQG